MRDEIRNLNAIIKLSLRNQVQIQATNPIERDIIKTPKTADNAQWQKIPSRGKNTKTQTKIDESQVLKQTQQLNRFQSWRQKLQRKLPRKQSMT